MLSQALALKDFSNQAEPPLIKAMRRDRYDLVELMLQINKDKILSYDEVLCLTDAQDRNILHHAVLKEHDGIVRKLVHLDADHSKLRNQKDSKGKTPMIYDGKNLFKDVFTTVWDAAREGNLERLKSLIEPGSND